MAKQNEKVTQGHEYYNAAMKQTYSNVKQKVFSSSHRSALNFFPFEPSLSVKSGMNRKPLKL